MCVLTEKAKRASLVMSQCHGNTEERLRLFEDSPCHQKCPSSLGMPKASETSNSASSLNTCPAETHSWNTRLEIQSHFTAGVKKVSL